MIQHVVFNRELLVEVSMILLPLGDSCGGVLVSACKGCRGHIKWAVDECKFLGPAYWSSTLKRERERDCIEFCSIMFLSEGGVVAQW